VNNGFKTEGYQNERYQNRGFHDNIYDKDDFDFESGRHKTPLLGRFEAGGKCNVPPCVSYGIPLFDLFDGRFTVDTS
jgi:hypothetical protein